MAPELRMLTQAVELRVDGEAQTLAGYGAVFNREAVIAGYFREVILPGAFKDSLRDEDVVVSFNHDANYVLGRKSSDTATVSEDDTGLRYAVQVNPDDPDHVRVLQKVRRRDVKGSSFMFEVERDEDEAWVRDDPAKLPLRQVKRARLYETGPVTYPAYQESTVSARAQGALSALSQREEAALTQPVVDVALLRARARARVELEIAGIEA